MIFDVFPYNGEADMLECKLASMSEAVDVFVIVEATRTFRNQPKLLHFEAQRDRFKKWDAQIEYVVPLSLPDGPDPWMREHATREWGRWGLDNRNVSPADIVIVSDVDEILRPEVVANLDPDGFQVCELSMRSFAVDWLHPDPWSGPVAVRHRNLTDGLALARLRRLPDYIQNPAHVEHVPDAGWHFSWVGSHEERETKLGSFSHDEINPNLGLCYEQGWHVHGEPLEPLDPPHDLPAWVIDHAPKTWWRP